MTEAEFLDLQATAARKAIADAFGGLKEDLAKGADPRVWMKSHPWLTLASAAAAGFAAAAAVVPSREQQALNRLQRIEAALNAGRHGAENGKAPAPEPKGHHGLISMLFHEAFGVIKPAIISLITNWFTSLPPAKKDEGAKSDEESGAEPGAEEVK
jgi:hypothetical protein